MEVRANGPLPEAALVWDRVSRVLSRRNCQETVEIFEDKCLDATTKFKRGPPILKSSLKRRSSSTSKIFSIGLRKYKRRREETNQVSCNFSLMREN